MIRRNCLLIVCAVLLSGTTGCPRDDSAPTDSNTKSGAAARNELERLRALPYAGFSDDPSDENQQGVVHIDEDRSYPGYNLYSTHRLASAHLIDAHGNEVRSWRDPQGRHWSNCELLPNGDLLVVGTDLTGGDDEKIDDKSRFAARFSFSGELIWKKHMTAHHDIEQTPRGQLLTLRAVLRRCPTIEPKIDTRDNMLTLLTPDGKILEEQSLFDLLNTGSKRFHFQPGNKRNRKGVPQNVLFHGNSVEWMHRPELAAKHRYYALDNVLVCSRQQDSIMLFDWDAKELVWSWGQGELSGPHDATVLDNGNILIFDNGLRQRWSRVIELDPIKEKIVWEYKAPEPTAFFTITRGSNQRLPNGNTLIANSEAGQAFEVTREGEMVWEFWSPHFNDKGQRGTIVRMKRYETAFVEGLLKNGGEAVPSANSN